MTTLTQETPAVAHSRRAPFLIAGASALVGVMLIFVDNLILGNPPRTAPLEVLEYVRQRPWSVSRMVGLLGMLAWLLAFDTLGGTLTTVNAKIVARLGRAVLIVATAVFAVQYAHDGFGLGNLATDWSNHEITRTQAIERVELANLLIGGNSILAQTLLGLGLALYAAALVTSRQYSRFWCWFGVTTCAGWFLSAATVFSRFPGASFEIVLPFAGLATVWVTALAIAVTRRGLASGALPQST